MSVKLQKPELWKIIFATLIFLCILPVIYFGVYRVSEYYVCRSLISQKLGMFFSPYSIEGYIQNSLSPGMTRDEVVSTLEEIGEIKVIPLGHVNDVQSDQVNIKICTHPLNRVIIFTNYTDGKLISIKINSD